jgi:hypothetical protein
MESEIKYSKDNKEVIQIDVGSGRQQIQQIQHPNTASIHRYQTRRSLRQYFRALPYKITTSYKSNINYSSVLYKYSGQLF